MTATGTTFRDAVLEVVAEVWWADPCAIFEFLENHLTREGTQIFALEHTVFAAHFPRWFGNVIANCPHLEARRYMIQNMYVEEVHDPTVSVGHYESMVVFAVGLGLDEAYVREYAGHIATRMGLAYWDNVSRTRPWLEGFAAIAGLEIKANRALAARFGKMPLNSRQHFAPLGLPDSAMIHWASAEAADHEEGGHGDATVSILEQYATTPEQQAKVLATLRESMEVSRFHFDMIGRRAIEASRAARGARS
jgi:pyrroloquinoline quinone (PQQ) biosynthesis protein C